MKLFIDGAPAPLLKVNEAFAGARLPQGEHDIRLTFTPPGKPLGVAASLGFCAIYLVLIGLSVPPFGANRLSPFDPQSC